VGRFKNEFEPIFHFAFGEIKFLPENSLLELSESHKKIMANKDARFARGYKHSSGMGNMAGMRDNMQGARPGNVIAINTGDISHGAQGAGFPVALPAFFIKAYSDPGDVILDPFCGSGTTIVAAHNEKRIGVGIEKLEKYTSVILERLAGLGLTPTRLEAQ
jgi:site-specific DNA-methyltransferase (adenine-specific)